MITKDNQNLPVLEITPDNYRVPAGEERFYHVKMEIKSFDQHTGERLSHPYVQKFLAVDFENGMMSSLRQQGYDMVILHNPKEWMEAHAKEMANIRAQKEAEARAKAEAEKKAMKEKLKEELRKELLAEMAEERKEKRGNKKKSEESAEDLIESPELS